jgi:UDP-glucose 6-dehydrogenase
MGGAHGSRRAGREFLWTTFAVVGPGYGLVAAARFSEIGDSVICVNNDERKVAALGSVRHTDP